MGWEIYFWLRFNNMKKQKIILADSSIHFREGLKRILLNIGNVEIAGEVENGAQLLDTMKGTDADIVFLEVAMPEMNGYEATMLGHQMYPETRFVAFSSLENPRYVNRLKSAGASGYLAKSEDNLDLLHDIVYGNPGKFVLSKGLFPVSLVIDQ